MQIRVDFDAIFLHELSGSLIVSLTLHALDLGQELGEELTQPLVVVDAHIGLTVALHHFHGAIAVGIAPSCDERTVAHVCFLDDMSGLDAHQLRHQTVHHIVIVLTLVSLLVGREPEFHELVIGQIIESEEVGTRLLYRAAIGFERVGRRAGQELTTAMTQTLMQIGMEIITEIAIFADQRACLLIDDKLLVHSRTFGSLVVSLREIADCHAL